MTSPATPRATRAALAVSATFAVSAAFAAPGAIAQTTAIDSVIVTASRTPQLASEVIADTLTISAQDIANAGVGSLTELLQRQRGLEVTRNGGPGTNASVLLRGASANQSIVLVDGVRIGSVSGGAANWSAIPLSAIDHIEIVYGPLSTLYGADAIGGVIQLFTKKGKGAPAVTAFVGAGSDATYEADAAISGGTDRVSYSLSVGKELSEGFSATRAPSSSYNPDDDGYHRKSAAGQVSVQLAPGHEVGGVFLYSDTTADYDSGAFDAYSTQVQSNFAAYSRNRITPKWTMFLQAAQSRDKSGSFYAPGPFGGSQIDSKQTTFTWQNDIRIGSDNLQLLAEHRKEEADGTTTELNKERTTKSYAATYSLKRGAHLVNIGVRNDDSSQYHSRTTGSLGYGYRVSDALRVEASFGTSYRAPTFNELYYSGYGNENNRPEKGRNAEIGAHYNDGTTELGAVYYHNKLTDLLVNTTPCPFPSDEKNDYTWGCAYNVNKGLLEGLTLNARRQFGAFSVAADIDFQDPRDETTGKRLQRRAKRHANVIVEYVNGPLTGGVEWHLSSARFDDAANRNTLPGYGTVNLYATYRFARDWSALIRWNNVADKAYELARYYQTGGSTAFAGVRYGFK
ncbi:TonB-dependent receptor plug domain-containing protein [Pseudoduganella plicata]|uniref:Outer membrane protein n=1 Tax=Pseudoduganella plicata TaxID=321984 RepID=A0A4P7BKF5_9BURK|nr:TonB-dependent receptor [Pseudoduganella plicata]QBQ38175.1 TonB-dependent receptor [Pseudoduganella plicata]GGZ11337.1 outer membrane protein [Pseudoduganella plicata]